MNDIARDAHISQAQAILNAAVVAASQGIDPSIAPSITDAIAICGSEAAFQAFVEQRAAMLAADGDEKRALRAAFGATRTAIATADADRRR